MRIIEIKEQITEKRNRIEEIINLAKTEIRDLSEDEQKEVDEIKEEIEKKKAEIKELQDELDKQVPKDNDTNNKVKRIFSDILYQVTD
jgi:predicted nuclease with TOPRIM domain